jgi:hypothetical protein
MTDCVQHNQGICIIHTILCQISNNKQTFESVKHQEIKQLHNQIQKDVYKLQQNELKFYVFLTIIQPQF